MTSSPLGQREGSDASNDQQFVDLPSSPLGACMPLLLELVGLLTQGNIRSRSSSVATFTLRLPETQWKVRRHPSSDLLRWYDSKRDSR